jgi:hypothetical protein
MAADGVSGRDTAYRGVLEISDARGIYSSSEKSAVSQRSGRIVNRIPG